MANMIKTYDDMRCDFKSNLSANCYHIDTLINNNDDTRRGITALSYIDGEVANKISSFLSDIKQIEPQQYCYPQNEIHLTVLSIISCAAGFKLSDIELPAYITVFN